MLTTLAFSMSKTQKHTGEGVYHIQQGQQLERIFVEKTKTAYDPSELSRALTVADDQQLLNRAICALQRGPVRYHRNNVVVCEGDPADYMFLVVSGTVRTCRTYQTGNRSIIAFYLPGDLLGWTNSAKHSLSVEAATDAIVVFFKRRALLSIASRESRIASSLLAATTNELRRTQEHALLISKSAGCRVATFLTDLWTRLGKTKQIDLPMSHQDIADHLGLTIETVSRVITNMERSGLVRRVSHQKLILQNRLALEQMVK
jgi:CRP/FNR family transcriptional regulator, nitrogen fixation regulation protein